VIELLRTITGPTDKSGRHAGPQKRREGAKCLLDEFVDRVEQLPVEAATVATIQEIR
jgi:hypothetical protein